MATRLKTIEYVFPTNIATLSGGTRRDFSAITVYIPEASGSITFRSVEVEVMVADDAATAANVTSWLIGIKLGAVAFSDATVTDTITNSGEAQAYIFSRDVTSYFTSNWSGTSMTCQVGIQLGTAATQNHSAKLKITYEYDDTQSTHVKTVRIPIESTRTLLTTSWQTVGGATAIPAITGGYLPEASVTVRQVWLELWGNERTGTTGDFICQARVNGGTARDWWDCEAALQSSRWGKGIVDITSEDLSAARSLECIANTTTSRMGAVGGLVCVTYEFAPASSTTILNSLILGAYDSVGQCGETTSADADAWGRDIYIEEPATITMKESAVCLFGTDIQNYNLNVAVGSQGYTTYSVQETTGVVCGQWSLVHRIDSGGTAGAGMTLARGKNSYVIKLYSSTTLAAGTSWGVNGFLVLNYTSGKSSQGVGAHAHTCYHSVSDTAADTGVRIVTATAPSIPETDYWLMGAVAYALVNTDNSTGQSITISAERKSGEAEGSGWEILYAGVSPADNENEILTVWGAARKAWKRHPGDKDTGRMDIETSRRWKIDCQPVSWTSMGFWFTYHSILFTVAGDVTGSGGGTVNLYLHRASDGEMLESTSRSGNGAFSMNWHDNTENVYVDAYEDGTHMGRSANDVAAGSP